jgi:hypothetical protein
MFTSREIIVAAILTGIVVAAILAAWPWGRDRLRFALAGLTTVVGFAAWNFTLNHTNATGFDVDAPIVRVSWQDAGSAVLVFSLTALMLGLVGERREPAQRVVGAAAVAGVVALVYDTFLF